jgi:hypothetical protein
LATVFWLLIKNDGGGSVIYGSLSSPWNWKIFHGDTGNAGKNMKTRVDTTPSAGLEKFYGAARILLHNPLQA